MAEIIGSRFGRLTVVAYVGQDVRGHSTKWLCACDCGGQITTRLSTLRRKDTQSCGCLQRERASAANRAMKPIHGMHASVEYRAWQQMKQRCLNVRHAQYPDYGGRGIVICDEWVASFQAFYRDLGPRPTDRHSLDRIDNDRGYSPDNCRWATFEQQNANRRYFRHGFGRRQRLKAVTVRLDHLEQKR